MNYGNIKDFDVANGEGIRVSLFVSGCTNHCKGCFQKETWDFDYGKPYTPSVEQYILDKMEQNKASLSILGGEPFEPSNQEALISLLRKAKERYPTRKIWCYSGFLLEDLQNENFEKHTNVTNEMLSLIDVLVDGKYVEELKDISLAYRGSSNQRVIDLEKTRKTNTIQLLY